MENKNDNRSNLQAEAFFADVRGCKKYITFKKIAREALILLGVWVISFLISWIWLVYIVYILRVPIMKWLRWINEMNSVDIPIQTTQKPIQPEPQPKKEFYFTDGSGNFAKSGSAFRDWSGQIVQWGSPFRDKRGNLIQWGSAFYDNRDNLVQWGSPFYDPGDNLVFPQ